MRVHALHLARPRTRAIGVLAILVVAMVFALARPASAHLVDVSGTTSCPDDTHVVSWTIHNNETLPDRPMTIDDVWATIDGTTYPVTGYSEPVAPGGSTQATTIVPGAVNGTIKLTVEARWPDNFTNRASGTVELQPPCPHETATTAPPTTAPPTTTPSTGGTAPTTAGPPDTAGSVPPVPPGPSSPDDTGGGVAGIEAGGEGTLPTTGGSSTNWLLVGLASLAFGASLLAVTRRRSAPAR